MINIFEQIGKIKLVPVIAIPDASKAVELAQTLINAGLSCAEITFRTAAAEEVIQKISKAYPEMMLGAGTVLNVEQAKRAKKAGAKYVVSPGYSPKIIDWCQANDMTVLPGVATPSEIMTALDIGLNVLKFFPAENLGGVGILKALAGPFKEVKFIPTGGINIENLAEYLGQPNVLAVGGSWFVKEALIVNSQFDQIGNLIKEALNVVKNVPR
jgi:2-dehydro-3-deoxyphosphogluconate aldolase/(4S)-4-hydroxy-2-oxoglutarate aldolase